MPRPRRKNIWQIRRVPEAFVAEGAGGYAYAHFCIDGIRWRKSLRPIRFVVADKPMAMAVLSDLSEGEAWRFPPKEVRIHPRGRVDIPVITGSHGGESSLTVDDLYRRYYALKESRYRDGKTTSDPLKRQRLAQAAIWNGFEDRFLSDIEGIREHVLERILDVDVVDRSKKRYLQRQRAMFDFGVETGMMEKNPLPALQLIALHRPGAKETSRKRKRAMTPDEYARLVENAYSISRHVGLVVELYFLTGMRTNEATALRTAEAWRAEGKTRAELAQLPHVEPGNFLHIRGKGTSGQPRWRTFPLVMPAQDDDSKLAQWQRRQHEVVDELCRDFAPDRDGYLIGASTRYLQSWLLKARDKARLPRDEVDNHSLRRTGLTYMVNELHIGKDWLDQTVGNTDEIRKRLYVAAATAEQLRDLLEAGRS